MQARGLAARVRVGLAVLGAALVGLSPELTPHPDLALVGWAIIAATGVWHRRWREDRWLAVEECAACLAGVLLVTNGVGRVTVVTLLWLACVAAGVVARGGRVGPWGRVLILAVLASPLVRFGLRADGVGLLAAGSGLLLVVGRVTVEISELLRDPLTGVVSRASLAGQLSRALAGGRGAGLVIVDLDDFGAVNKRDGYAAGDRLLVRAVGAMGAVLGDRDVLGRLGGDEFAVLVSAAEAIACADELVRALGAAGVPASAGVAVGPGDGADPGTLLAAADTALRQAKAAGKQRAAVYQAPPASHAFPLGAAAGTR